jgi:hypothetical protein
LGPQFEAFLQKCPFARARVIAKHFLITIPTVKEILQRELGMRKFSRRWVSHSLSSAHKVVQVEASKEMLRILQESETNPFDEIVTGAESWFQYLDSSLKMFAHSGSDVVPRTRQGLGTKKTMITLFFNGRKLIVLDVVPKGRKYNQRYFVHNIFPDLKHQNRRYQRRNPGSTFWVHIDNSIIPPRKPGGLRLSGLPRKPGGQEPWPRKRGP